MQIPFLGPTYNARSTNIDASRSVNFYPEIEAGDSKTILALIGTPGTSLFAQMGGTNPVRGMHAFNNLLFVVIGSSLYSVNASGIVSSSLGTLSSSSGLVSMEDNGLTSAGVGGNQLIIVDGISGYIYNVITGTFSTISGGGFPTSGAIDVTYIDGYFVVNTLNSMSFDVSNLYDGTTWNALATSPVSAAPDLLVSVANVSQQLWLIKQYSTEVWYDTGAATSQGSPFSRIGGAVIDYGTDAWASVVRANNSLYWLANQRNNSGAQFVGAVGLSGYSPQVISPPAITYQMSLLPRSDAFGFSYSEGGHTFCVWTFPSGNSTYVYDLTTQMWHEWSSYTNSPYGIGRYLANTYCFFNGKHYIGDYQSGNIYEMSSTYLYEKDTNPIVSVRQSQPLYEKNEDEGGSVHRLYVDAETGVGGSTSGLDPGAALSWSDDGGHTWSNEYSASLGKSGAYKSRLIWRRLGYTPKTRIFRLSISDPVKRVLISANVEATAA